MKNRIFLKLIFLFTLGCSPIKKLYVPFSEAKTIYAQQNDGVIRVYFDRYGFIYPDVNLSQEEFIKSHGSLARYYNTNENYQIICSDNNVQIGAEKVDELYPSKDPLQQKLINNYINTINKSIEAGKKLVFIVHGFNEYPLERREPSSYNSMAATRQIIESKLGKQSVQFVEVYWDGLSVEGGPCILEPINAIKIWDNAQTSASNCGLELRRILYAIEKEKVYLVTHSHGAALVTGALFNVNKFKEGDFLEILKTKYQLSAYNTPRQEFIVGMLAPAIPGENVFDEYYCRTVNGEGKKIKNDNYRFIIGFNQNDPITSKFRLAAKKVGSTSLNAKRKELAITKNMFTDISIIDEEDFSHLENGKKQNEHGWLYYLNNKNAIDRFFAKVFNLLENSNDNQ